MKNIWTALLVVSIVAFVGCKEKYDVYPPKSPKIVRAQAVPAIVDYDGSTIIYWQVENAKDNKSVEIQGIKEFEGVKFGSKDSLVVKNLKSNMTVLVVAFGEGSLTAIKRIAVSVSNPKPPTIQVEYEKDSIPYGTSTSFSWKIEGPFTSVTLKEDVGIPVDVTSSSSFTTPFLFYSTTKAYQLSVEGPGGKVTETIELKVHVGLASSYWEAITYEKPYMLKDIIMVQDGIVVGSLLLTEADKTDLRYFSPSLEATVYQADGKLIGRYGWSFVGDDKIKIGGQIYMIFSLKKDEFIYGYEVPNGDKMETKKFILYRP